MTCVREKYIASWKYQKITNLLQVQPHQPLNYENEICSKICLDSLCCSLRKCSLYHTITGRKKSLLNSDSSAILSSYFYIFYQNQSIFISLNKIFWKIQGFCVVKYCEANILKILNSFIYPENNENSQRFLKIILDNGGARENYQIIILHIFAERQAWNT